MLRLTGVIGDAAEPALAEQLHALEHRGAVEHVTLRPEDVARRRLRALTDRGAACAIILSRSEQLRDGAVLLLEPDRAVVVRVAPEEWLRLEPRDAATALELGYLAGNLHWKVRFEGELLWVRLDGDPAAYRARLSRLLQDQRMRMTRATAAPPATALAGLEHDHHAHDHHAHDHHAHGHHGGHAHPLDPAGEDGA